MKRIVLESEEVKKRDKKDRKREIWEQNENLKSGRAIPKSKGMNPEERKKLKRERRKSENQNIYWNLN